MLWQIDLFQGLKAFGTLQNEFENKYFSVFTLSQSVDRFKNILNKLKSKNS